MASPYAAIANGCAQAHYWTGLDASWIDRAQSASLRAVALAEGHDLRHHRGWLFLGDQVAELQQPRRHVDLRRQDPRAHVDQLGRRLHPARQPLAALLRRPLDHQRPGHPPRQRRRHRGRLLDADRHRIVGADDQLADPPLPRRQHAQRHDRQARRGHGRQPLVQRRRLGRAPLLAPQPRHVLGRARQQQVELDHLLARSHPQRQSWDTISNQVHP